MLQYQWKILTFIFITLFRPGISVQSRTQQASVLAFNVRIEKDNVNKYLHHVIVFVHWFGLSSPILIRVNSNAFKLVLFCPNSQWWCSVTNWNFKPVLSIIAINQALTSSIITKLKIFYYLRGDSLQFWEM